MPTERMNKYSNVVIDIDNNIAKLNDKVLDNKSRKDIASELKCLIPELSYRFNRGIILNGDEKLVVTVPNDIKEMFKNTYRYIRLYCDIQSGEDKWYLMEGCRRLSLEEMHHIIGLIYEPENTRFDLYLDLYTEK